ncbi:MAG: hypothetical protein RXN93_07645 [Thermocladium sp.]
MKRLSLMKPRLRYTNHGIELFIDGNITYIQGKIRKGHIILRIYTTHEEKLILLCPTHHKLRNKGGRIIIMNDNDGKITKVDEIRYEVKKEKWSECPYCGLQ